MRCLLLIFLVILSSSVHAVAKQNLTTKFCVFPMMSMKEIRSSFGDIATLLSESINIQYSIESAASFSSFFTMLKSGACDLAFVQPFDYVDTEVDALYYPVARRNIELTSIIIVRKDHPLAKLNDITPDMLRGMALLSPPPRAAVTQIMKDLLKQHDIEIGVDTVHDYVRNHSACIQSVVRREKIINRNNLKVTLDGCITTTMVLDHPRNRRYVARTKTVLKSSGYPHTLFIALKSLPPVQKQVIRNTIINLNKSEIGKNILQQAPLKYGFIETTREEYDIYRKWNSK